MGLRKLVALAMVGLLTACDFEPHLTPVVWPADPSMGGPESDRDAPLESYEAGIIRLLNELFDPFNLSGDQPYRGSVYEQMDVILEGAYAYYGYDLADLALRKQDNPVTDQMFLDYLNATGQTLVYDPLTGESRSVYDWLQSRTIGAGEGAFSLALREIEGLDRSHALNYERNYLDALFRTYPLHVFQARLRFQRLLDATFGEDARAAYEYINSLDQFDIE